MLAKANKKKVTQAEVAEKAGVSRTTVSLVLNGRTDVRISEETRKRVMRAIEELGYVYSEPIEVKKTKNIAYFISRNIHISDPYYHRFFAGVEEAAQKFGKSIFVEVWRDNLSPIFWNSKVDGVIIADPCGIDGERIKQIQRYVPVVLLNWSLEAVICDMVVPDNAGGVKKAFDYLYKLGHRRIGFFGLIPAEGVTSYSRLRERLQGYYMGLEDYKLPVNKEYLQLPICKTRDIKEVEEHALRILKKWKNLPKPPTALITYNDIYGISFIKMAPLAGVKIPDDLSIIGFDNIIACDYVSPTLSSINQPMEEMGRLSVEILEERIKKGNVLSFKKIICSTELVVRESVKEIRGE